MEAAQAAVLRGQHMRHAGVHCSGQRQAAQSTDTSPAGAAATGTDLPAAAAYFPLLSSDVTSSYPAAAYEGVAHNLDWVEDPAFGQVMACDEARQSYVSIPGLEYGQGGGLAVAFWAKVRPHSGASMDYAYSHTNAANTDYAFDPNTVAVFFPERDHPDFGVARAMLRDATDVRTNGTDPFYLDSSGCVASSAACTPAAAGAANLAAAEGQWHLLGLSTRPGGGKGFQLYVNGTLAAEAKEDAEGFTKTATGGGPMNLTGNITLCSRSDLEPTRFFGGSIAHLLIYNTSLTPDQMRLIYETGQPQSQSASPAAAPVPAGADQAAASPGATDASSVDPASAAQQAVAAGFQPAPGCITSCADDNGVPVCLAAGGQVRQCTASNTSTGAPVIGAAEQQQAGAAAVAPDSPPAAAQQPGSDPSQGVAQLGGQPLCSESPIQGVSTVQACAAGYICAPLSRQQIAANFGGQLPLNVGDIGVCAYMPHDLMLPNATDVPPAMAFFPLNSQTLQSFPLPEHTGSASGAGVVGDPLFGSALLCTQSDRDLVALDPVQYARSGAFSINLWFKPENMSGEAACPSAMYLPQEEHPAYGVVRAIVKDFDDQPTSMGAQTWLDSDGNVAYNGERSTSPQSPSLFDGDWHMATLTSQPGGGRGYRMYLDGQLAGEVAEGRSYVSPEGFPIPIDGGDPMLLDGNVVLCVRSDDPGGRHYDGQLAHLGLHDTALDETQVGLLYSEVSRNMGAATSSSTITPAGPELPVLSPSSGANITRFSISGQRCQFPALYNGELATDCVTVEGMSFCQIEENVWEECVPLGGEVAAASTGGPMYSSDPSQAPPSSAAEEPSSSDPSAAASPIIIADSGAQCQLPLRYNGMQVDGCVNIDGSYQCWGMETDSWEGCPTDLMETQPEGGELGVPASSVALHVVPSISRQTASGDACQLPVGEILDDCIDRNGTWSCLDSSLSWQQCDLGSSPPPTDDQGQLLVTQRTTTSGEACLLPAVFRGHLFFDCVDYSDAQTGTAEICPTQAATWELCSNSGFTGQEQPDPQPFRQAGACR
ncbi:hypothetical protein CHLNCDRAFT_137883 [Chlorella variabilis]|uniref:LamG-like jellyroll fold domain-containing protein n=1 Tax=Chlorella variabilis TaxID=554065 RepID=E1Z4R2_CHLVA|nr:hypothetical protein CHLNCDRAFT_137883 [Chlorella variabilis]EFN59099.1 hypothetical protein CHLNCDRAFT_137883 [Chlorella variabilis]|eukprot:XP_005851201.1 hypothetical protein CHLNCDRAFT_137883 [Chlorella variabilis]